MAKNIKRIFRGNNLTVVAIILILAVSIPIRSSIPTGGIKNPPERIKYIKHEYEYRETIDSSPIKFLRGKRGSDEGFRVLIMRKDKRAEVPDEVYIYKGGGEYLKYIIAY